MVAVHTPTPGCFPQNDPVGRTITPPIKPLTVHQRLHQPGVHRILPPPICAQPPQSARQQHAGQVADTRHNKHAAVVDHVLQSQFACFIVPADPLIPNLHPPGRARKLNASHHFAPGTIHINQILQPRSVGHGISEVVITADKLPIQQPLLRALDQLHIQWSKCLHAAGKRAVNLPVSSRRNPLSGSPRPGRLFGRKRQNPLALQSLQQVPALPCLEPASGALPLQQFAYRIGQLQPADPCTGRYNLLDQRHLFRGKLSATESLLIFCCVFHTIVRSSQRYNRTDPHDFLFVQDKVHCPLYGI